MFLLQLFLLPMISLVGILFNWLLILAIQRKSYHYQYSHRIPSPVTNKSLLRPQASISGQIIQPPLLPSVRSSISIFDKFILAFLINDIFVCNFLLPLRLIDLSQGLPCGFLCFMMNFLEKLTTTIELIIINLLLTSSLIFFWKRRLLTKKWWVIVLLFMLPILVSCLITAFTYLDVEEDGQKRRPPTCKQTFVYISPATERTLTIFTGVITYLLIFINCVLIIKMKWAIKKYKADALKSLTEAAISTKTDLTALDQNTIENNRRRSMYYSPSITMESTAPNSTPPVQRSFQAFDYLSYLTIIENSHTLVRSTSLILFLYFLFHTPYWFYELSNKQHLRQWKDLFFLCHICKPFCYIFTNTKYRHHVWAILQCRTFRMLPNLLRRKSRTITTNNHKHSFSVPTI